MVLLDSPGRVGVGDWEGGEGEGSSVVGLQGKGGLGEWGGKG